MAILLGYGVLDPRVKPEDDEVGWPDNVETILSDDSELEWLEDGEAIWPKDAEMNWSEEGKVK